MLGIAACLQRHPDADAELPDPFKTLDLKVASFRLVLVIKGHEGGWLPPLEDALRDALRATLKTGVVPTDSVKVINDAQARELDLVAGDATS